MRRRNVLISIVSAVAAGLLVYGIYVLQIRHIQLQQTIRVVVPGDFVRAGETLNEANLMYRPILMASYEQSMFTDIGQLVGMETVVPIGKDEPITDWKVDRYSLWPHANEATVELPKEYVASVFGGIRAGDKVRVYITAANAPSRRLFIRDITVASVKTSSNAEIDNAKDSNLLSRARGDKEKMYASRREANGSIDRINLNLREEEWLELDNACKGGKAKLVVAFVPDSLESAAIDQVERGRGG